MNAQEIFDTVATHLLTQRRKSMTLVNGEPLCLYRDPIGLKCAVGCLITDEEYYPEMEGQIISAVFNSHKLQRFKPFHDLLFNLQRIHDSYEVTDWECNLRYVAQKEGLEFHIPPGESE